jgi:hypothetical protein
LNGQSENAKDQEHRMSDSDSTQDDAAMPPASTGSVADEPVAWAVLRVGGGWVSILANEVQAEASRKSWDARENWVHEVIPLYRLPTLTDAEREATAQLVAETATMCVLTDAEREAVCVAMNRCEGPVYRTLRSLLERT